MDLFLLPQLVSIQDDYSPSDVLNICHWAFKQAHYPALHQAWTVAHQLGATVLIAEDASTRNEVREELDALRAARPSATIHTAIALSFFRTERELGLELTQEDSSDNFVARALAADTRNRRRRKRNREIGPFLGQVVIINFGHDPEQAGDVSYIFEALMMPPTTMCAEDSHVQLRTFQVRVRGKEFSVNAAYYCQQNGITSNCGHAVVRTILHTANRPITVAQIDDVIDPASRLTPNQMPVPAVAQALEKLGAPDLHHPKLLEARGVPREELLTNLVAVIESGYPALLSHGVETVGAPADHIVAVVGYAIDRNLWHPQAVPAYNRPDADPITPLNSAAWVRHLIVHDENFGPYRTLGIRSFPSIVETPTSTPPEPRALPDRLKQVIISQPALVPGTQFGVFGHPVQLPPVLILALSRRILKAVQAHKLVPHIDGQNWANEFFANPADQVLRPLIINQAAYFRHLSKLHGADHTNESPSQLTKSEQNELKKTLAGKPWFWMVELSHALLYTGRDTKIGELLMGDFSGLKEDVDKDGWWLLRLPHHMIGEIGGKWIELSHSLKSHAPMYYTKN